MMVPKQISILDIMKDSSMKTSHRTAMSPQEESTGMSSARKEKETIWAEPYRLSLISPMKLRRRYSVFPVQKTWML